MIQIVVYTTGDDCMQCRLTKQLLDAAGLVYREVNLAEPSNAVARTFVTDDLGYLSVPVVVVGKHHHWAGFRPDCINDLASRLNEPASGRKS